jgi:hypothetical protein
MGNIGARIASKVTRAKQHLADLELALSAFRNSNAYEVRIKEDASIGKRIYYVHRIEDVPTDVTNIAADVIQNLRSPLDQIAHQLVLDATSGAQPEGKVYYPIAGSATYYKSTRGGIAKYVRHEVIDAIDATEPYKGGKGERLWQLNALNNPDKHHLPLTAGIRTAGVDVSGDFLSMLRKMPGFESVTFPSLFIHPADQRLGTKVGDELYIEPLEKEVVPDRKFSLEITFDEPGIIESEPILKFLQDTTNLVDDVITTLGKLLP